jgi:adenosylmethionine-8-amino-7-oxononanoate aminotransferase
VGDLLMLAPPFIIQEEEIRKIYGVLEELIREAAMEIQKYTSAQS